MAKVTNPLMSQDARGSISGIQFSHNPSGQFCSRKSTSTRAQRGNSTNFRANLKRAHTAWGIRSAADQSIWDAYAPPRMTGRNFYIGCALRLFSCGLAPPTTTPPGDLDARLPYVWYWVPSQVVYPNQRLSWTIKGPSQAVATLSYAFVETETIPHVRKFRHIATTPTIFRPLNFVLEMPTEYFAMRIRMLHNTTGVILQESRWVLDPLLDKTLKMDYR